MEMRAIEDIAIGEDLTPPLTPLAFVLHDSALSSYCSACFSTLPPRPFPPSTPTFSNNSCHVPSNAPTPLYCSPNCSSVDSPVYFSSGEPHLLSLFHQSPRSAWNDSSDLRLSLRLVYIFQNLSGEYSALRRFPGSMSSDDIVFFGRKKGCPVEENENSEGPDNDHENKENPMENVERIVERSWYLEKRGVTNFKVVMKERTQMNIVGIARIQVKIRKMFWRGLERGQR